MACSTDCLGLSSIELTNCFNSSRKDSPDFYTKNIVDFGDDVLFGWDSEDQCLIATFLRYVSPNNPVKYTQKLRPTEIIGAEVLKIVLNHDHSRIALVCKWLIYVIHLPSRVAPRGYFKKYNGGDVSCRSRLLEVQLGKVRAVRWHPGSPGNNHLVVLTYDNVIHINDVSIPSFIDSWTLYTGPYKRIPSLESVGKVAVDFAFLPLAYAKYYSSTVGKDKRGPITMKWPALVLQGNGDIIMIDLTIKNEGRRCGNMSPPLLMSPSTDDNYGDSSGILILNCQSPIVIISTSSGLIYHCMLVTHPNADYVFDNRKEKHYDKDEGKPADSSYISVLQILESVEVDIGLNLNPTNSESDIYETSSSINLVADCTNETRYCAFHAGGIHVISLPIIHKLKQYFASSKYDPNSPSSSDLDFKRTRCIVECVVCSHVCGFKPRSLLGITCVESPTPVLVVMFENEIMTLQLRSWFFTPNSLIEDDEDYIKSPILSPPSEFLAFIQHALHPPNSVMPVFKISGGITPTPQQSLELLGRATQYFREIVFPRHQLVAHYIRSKVKMLRKLKEQQDEDLKDLLALKTELQSKAEHLAEKYEDINEKQICIAKRAETVLVTIMTRNKPLTRKEHEMANTLKTVEKKIKDLNESIQGLAIKDSTIAKLVKAKESHKGRRQLSLLVDRKSSIIRSSISRVSRELEKMVDEIEIAEDKIKHELMFPKPHRSSNLK